MGGGEGEEFSPSFLRGWGEVFFSGNGREISQQSLKGYYKKLSANGGGGG